MLPRSRVVWPSIFGALAALNVWCTLGEANGDSISENVCAGVRLLGRPGPLLLDAGIFGTAIVLRWHWRKGLV